MLFYKMVFMSNNFLGSVVRGAGWRAIEVRRTLKSAGIHIVTISNSLSSICQADPEITKHEFALSH